MNIGSKQPFWVDSCTKVAPLERESYGHTYLVDTLRLSLFLGISVLAGFQPLYLRGLVPLQWADFTLECGQFGMSRDL